MKKLLVACIASFAIAARVRAQAPVFGDEFEVNTATPGYLSSPIVANLGPASDFVVVWTSDSDGSESGVVGRIFDANGTALGGEFAVNASTTGYQGASHVGSNAAGNFVVTWGETGSGAGPEVRARRFDASGAPQGGDIVVNTYTTEVQGMSRVAMNSAGEFVVVWTSGPSSGSGQIGQDGSEYGIFGRRYDANGNPLSGEFQVNQYTTGRQFQPELP